MKNEFDKLNEVDNDLYIEEIEVSEEEKESIRKRVMKKVEVPKKNSKKKIAMVASVCLILGGSLVLTNESVMATVERIGRSIESFLKAEEGEFTPYKSDVFMEVEDQGVKFILNEAILDGENLYISTKVDYSKFDVTTLDETIKGEYSLIVDEMEHVISTNNRKIENSGNGASYEYNNETKTVDILLEIDIEDEKRHENIYDIKLNIPTMTLQKKGDYKKIVGNWDMGFKVDGSKLEKETKVVEVNKEIELTRDDKTYKVNISEFRKSPISITMDYTITEGFEDILNDRIKDKNYEIGFKFYDQNGKRIDFSSQGGGGIGNVYKSSEKWIIDREITKIEVVPTMIYWVKNKYHNPFKNIKFEDLAFEIEFE
ncbi:MAG: DUF4179 domain-containing protein [Sarcina sp.]